MAEIFFPPRWALNTNIYEVNVRQYTKDGSFNAFARELPRLKDMGVKTLWFMPIYPIGKERRKGTMGSYYSIQNYLEVSTDYGTLTDFRSLTKNAKELGFNIMLDWVANHTSWDHEWTKTDPGFYTKDETGHFRPPYPDWADVIKLNYDNPDLRKAMIAAMKFWVTEFDIDGFRCDMAHLVPLDFWREARLEIDGVKSLFWLAETEETTYHAVFDASYTWDFLHKMEACWRKETGISGLETVLGHYETAFPPNSLRVYFTSNHDENSHSGSEYERMGDMAVPFAVFCATWKGIPLIYSGQELPNHKRLQFFEKDAIQWTGTNELHDFYKTLLNLRSHNPALWSSSVESRVERIATSDERVFAYLRKSNQHEVLIALNLSTDSVIFSVNNVSGNFREVFWKSEKDFALNGQLEMKAFGYLVFEKFEQ